MSERIQQTKVFGSINEKDLVDDRRGAHQAGLQARQHGQEGRDVDVDDSYKANLGRQTRGTPGDVLNREERENQHTVEVRRRIDQVTGDTMTYAQKEAMLKKALREKFAASGMGDIMDGMGDGSASLVGTLDPFEAGQMRAASQPRRSYEDDLSPPQINMNESAGGAWMIEEMTAQTKGGQQVLIWQVRDPNSGVTLPHKFRLSETAEKVVAVLNRSGNLNDPRVGQWIGVDKTRQALIGNARRLKEAYQAGNTGVKAQYAQMREQLAELDLKIGL